MKLEGQVIEISGEETDHEVVTALLRPTGRNGITDQLALADLTLMESGALQPQQARRWMRAPGAQGVPGLVVHTASGQRLLGGNALYGEIDQLMEQIAGCCGDRQLDG